MMRHRIYDILGGVCVGLLIASFAFQIHQKNLPATKEDTAKPWFEIPKPVHDKLLAKHVEIKVDGFIGSGCETNKPGFFLTSLHVISNPILDGSTISVNGQKAEVVWKSHTEEDYAILTTRAEYNKEKIEFPPYNNFGDNINIILVGSPGDQEKLVQPAKIIRSAIDKNKKVKEFAKIISAQYVDFGLSGGCAYSEDGETLLGVLTNMYENPGSTVGEITIVNRPKN